MPGPRQGYAGGRHRESFGSSSGKVKSGRWVVPPRPGCQRAVEVVEAHEGFGWSVGCNTPTDEYELSQ
jgi:hypothetical protein